jgi:competence protein ComEC
MFGERKWFKKKTELSDKTNVIEDEWLYEPLPIGTTDAPADKGAGVPNVRSDFSDDIELVENVRFDHSLINTPNNHPFTAEKVNRFTALRFQAETQIFNFRDSIRVALAKEYELGNQFNFVPVILAMGIGAYYYADSEPNGLALLATWICFAVLLLKLKTKGIAFGLSVAVFLFITGLLAAKIQMDRAVMPVPMSQLTGQISGVVQVVDQNRRGAARYLIRPSSIEGLAENELPNTIRLSASKKHQILSPGNAIEGLARLQPISGPAYPGSYDFAFASYLQGLGLSGFFMGAPTKVEAAPSQDWFTSASLLLHTVRGNISERIRSGLPGEAGDIATALITGDRSGLSKDTQESLRRSGLAHILAISGLHMALVTLTVIWLVRLILVFVPGLADHYPIKKWAIAAGFVTATLYLFISGASIATQRAWLMITVMLAASFMDRRALTMRSVTIAALIILLVSPASLFQPGFQMSFAAVAALVAVYQDWTRINRKRRAKNYEPKTGWFRQIFGYFGGLSATSLIAGFATALIAMAHFHRVAPMGLISNLVAMPLVSMLVMPLSLLSMFLMPYGFEGLALAPLGKSILGVVSVADWVNSYEFDFETGHRPRLFLVMAAGFLILGCFLRTRMRLLAIAPVIGLVGMANLSVSLPDILIGQDGRSIAIRTSLIKPKPESADGFTLLYPRSGKFTTEIWQKAFLPNRSFDALPDEINCSKDRCDFQLSNLSVKVIFDPKLLQAACETADLLLAPRFWWVNCRGKKPKMIINRTHLETNGSYQLEITGGDIITKTAWPNVGNHQKRRTWQKRFDNTARRYPPRIEIRQGPPRRREGIIDEIEVAQ